MRIPRILIRNHETPACSTTEPAQLGPWEPGESATTFLALCAVRESLRQEENLLPTYLKGFYSSRVAMGCLWPMSLGALWCPSRPLHHAQVLAPSFPQPPKAPRPTQTYSPLFGARPLPLQCLAMIFHTTVHHKHCNVSCRKVILVYRSRYEVTCWSSLHLLKSYQNGNVPTSSFAGNTQRHAGQFSLKTQNHCTWVFKSESSPPCRPPHWCL